MPTTKKDWINILLTTAATGAVGALADGTALNGGKVNWPVVGIAAGLSLLNLFRNKPGNKTPAPKE